MNSGRLRCVDVVLNVQREIRENQKYSGVSSTPAGRAARLVREKRSAAGDMEEGDFPRRLIGIRATL
jgi:hypothetical protein